MFKVPICWFIIGKENCFYTIAFIYATTNLFKLKDIFFAPFITPFGFLKMFLCIYILIHQAINVPGFIYGAQNEAYKGERGRKAPKAVYLQRVARVEAMRAAQNETFT